MDREKILSQISVSDLVWQPEKHMKPILDGIEIDLGSGEFYGILGPNGAGKTSFVRQLLQLTGLTAGTIRYDEMSITEMPRKEIAKQVSFLPQGIKADIDFSVRQIVAMGREPYSRFMSKLTDEDHEAIDEALEYTDCMKFADKSYQYLSGGERQRVMIARTIAQSTPWIILDEPVSNLDVKHQSELLCLFDRLRREKHKTIVAILHDLNIAMNFCSKVILMKDGHVCIFGDTEEVLNAENLEEMYGIPFDFVKREDPHKTVIVPRYRQ